MLYLRIELSKWVPSLKCLNFALKIYRWKNRNVYVLHVNFPHENQLKKLNQILWPQTAPRQLNVTWHLWSKHESQTTFHCWHNHLDWVTCTLYVSTALRVSINLLSGNFLFRIENVPISTLPPPPPPSNSRPYSHLKMTHLWKPITQIFGHHSHLLLCTDHLNNSNCLSISNSLLSIPHITLFVLHAMCYIMVIGLMDSFLSMHTLYRIHNYAFFFSRHFTSCWHVIAVVAQTKTHTLSGHWTIICHFFNLIIFLFG